MKPSIRTPLLLTISLLAAALFLTRGTTAKDDWLPIDPADLALKDNPMSPGAHAMILYRESFIDAKAAVTSNYLRVKVFTEEGKHEGDVEIQFDRRRETIRDIHARTIHADGSIVDFSGTVYEKELAKAGGIKYLAKTFSLPDVQPGSIIEYRFKVERDPDYRYDNEWILQLDMFTRLAKFSIMPDTSAYALPLYWRTYKTPPNVKPETQKDGSITMEVHNLPGLEEEDYMPPPISSARASLSFIATAKIPRTRHPTSSGSAWTRFGTTAWRSFLDKKKALQGSRVADRFAQRRSRSKTAETLRSRAADSQLDLRSLPETKKEEKREKLKVQQQRRRRTQARLRPTAGTLIICLRLARAAGFESSMAYVAPRSRNFFYPSMEDTHQLSAKGWFGSSLEIRILSRSGVEVLRLIPILALVRRRSVGIPPR